MRPNNSTDSPIQSDHTQLQIEAQAESLTLSEVVEAVSNRPDVSPFARIVGKWVWVQFDSKPAVETREYLKNLGFRWNRKRECWQHHCGYRSVRSTSDPRFKYGELSVSDFALNSLDDSKTIH